eukprot:303360_1
MGNKPVKTKQSEIKKDVKINSVTLQRKTDTNNHWVLIFRQSYAANSQHNTFWPKGEIKLNENHPSSANYSILHLLEEFRNEKDNKFEFKLIWPNNKDIKCQQWKQISNPANKNSSGNIVGYESININHTSYNWRGLEWTGTHSDTKTNDCLINGSTNSDYYWFYSIGSYRDWNGGIPGPSSMVTMTELWVSESAFDSQGEAFLRYFLQGLGIPNTECKCWLATQMDQYVYDIITCSHQIDGLINQNI